MSTLRFWIIIGIVFLVLLSFGIPAHYGWCADYDVTAAVVAADVVYNGYALGLTFAAQDTAGTFDFGLGTNNDPTNATVVLTVLSPGFDAAGDSTTLTLTLYGTSEVHEVYPGQHATFWTSDGTNGTVWIALSDYIYAGDVVTVSVGAGFYTQGGHANNAATDMVVTNNSTETCPLVVGNWSWPGWDRIASAVFKARCVAFHRSGQQGTPVRCVVFTATDEHSNADTVTVTAPTIDGDMADAMPVVEYIATMSATSLTQGDLVTINFIAYPWRGDLDSALDTGDAVNSMPTPLYAPQYRLCDKSGTYGVTVAVVDSTAGNDGTGAVVDSTSFDVGSPPNAYATIAAAATAIATYNNSNHTRNDVGGGYIYLRTGSYDFTAGTVTSGDDPEANITLTKFPTDETAAVFINAGTGSELLCHKQKVSEISIINTGVGTWDEANYLWLHDCVIDAPGAATYYRNICNYFTHCELFACAEYAPYSTTNSSRSIIRGCTSGEQLATSTFKVYTALGNDLDLGASTGFETDYSGQSVPAFSNIIFAYNSITQFSTGNAILTTNASVAQSHGIAVVQNVLEMAAVSSNSILKIAADASTSTPVNNVLIWYNTTVGQRNNLAYNSVNVNGTGTPLYRRYWSLIGNTMGDWNFVTDGETHGGTVEEEGYGGHGMVYGASILSNAVFNRVGAPDDYAPRFNGLGTYEGDDVDPLYTSDQSVAGDSTGNGLYALQAASEAVGVMLANRAVLPLDLAGLARLDDGTGSAGAYEYYAPREITVTAPEGQTYTAGDDLTVTWSNTGCVNVKLEWSADAGANWATVIASTTGSDETYAWTVPDTTSTEVQFKASDADSAYVTDTTDSDNTINYAREVTVLAPDGGETWAGGASEDITFHTLGPDSVKIEYSTDNGSSWLDVIVSLVASGSPYSWLIPSTATIQGLIKVTDVDSIPVYDESNAAFTITVEAAEETDDYGGSIQNLVDNKMTNTTSNVIKP